MPLPVRPARVQNAGTKAEHPLFYPTKKLKVPTVSQLSSAGQQLVQTLAQRYGLSTDAVTHMLIAVHNGNGTMAQFNHPEFGGSGQWMQGGMTMVSDLFNYALKNRVDGICQDISNELANHQLVPFSGSFQSQSQNGSSAQSQAAGTIGSQNTLFVPDPATNWWPVELGAPSAIGSQNNIRYAYFPASQRLAISTGGEPWVYDTLNHQIGGFSQQQGTGGSILLTSQFGTIDLATLPVVSRGGVIQSPSAPDVAPPAPPASESPTPPPIDEPTFAPVQDVASGEAPTPAGEPSNPQDIIETLDRLGALMEKGYLSEQEFADKKADLLSRL